MELFDCQGLRARISPAQCRSNRTRPVSSSLQNVPIRPPACFSCTQWKTFDPPLEVLEDPAELALAETIADLWNDIEEGRLGVKYILTAYNRRVPPELRKRRALQMGDWLQLLGLRVLAGETFRGIHGRHCLLVDGKVEGFVRERGVGFLREPDGRAAVQRLLQVAGLEEEPPAPAPDSALDPGLELDSGPEAAAAISEMPQAMARPARVGGMVVEGLSSGLDDPPCVRCRFFRPLPTFNDGMEGVRLCWSSCQAWDFSCFGNSGEAGREARASS
jgi:hypothetical protein